MATNYSKISSKKLTGMLANEISDEARNEINQVLATRQQLPDGVEKEVIIDELTPEEQAIMDTASEQPAAKKSSKLSLQECEEIAASLQANVGHLCKVVPAGKITWENGQIVGIVVDKRANKVLYMVRLKDRKILKAYDSEYLEISEEAGEIIKGRAKKSGEAKKVDADALVARAKEVAPNLIGQKVSFEPFKPIEGVPVLEGTIIAITPEKRVGKLLIKIKSTLPNSNIEIVGYKTEGNFELIGEQDMEVLGAYMKRLEVKEGTPIDPGEKVKLAAGKVEKAKTELEKWTKSLEIRMAEFAAAEEAYQAHLNSLEQPTEEQPTEELA